MEKEDLSEKDYGMSSSQLHFAGYNASDRSILGSSDLDELVKIDKIDFNSLKNESGDDPQINRKID